MLLKLALDTSCSWERMKMNALIRQRTSFIIANLELRAKKFSGRKHNSPVKTARLTPSLSLPWQVKDRTKNHSAVHELHYLRHQGQLPDEYYG
jgi:hypothetical protein